MCLVGPNIRPINVEYVYKMFKVFDGQLCSLFQEHRYSDGFGYLREVYPINLQSDWERAHKCATLDHEVRRGGALAAVDEQAYVQRVSLGYHCFITSDARDWQFLSHGPRVLIRLPVPIDGVCLTDGHDLGIVSQFEWPVTNVSKLLASEHVFWRRLS